VSPSKTNLEKPLTVATLSHRIHNAVFTKLRCFNNAAFHEVSETPMLAWLPRPQRKSVSLKHGVCPSRLARRRALRGTKSYPVSRVILEVATESKIIPFQTTVRRKK
jgi:hypothetical protein